MSRPEPAAPKKTSLPEFLGGCALAWFLYVALGLLLALAKPPQVVFLAALIGVPQFVASGLLAMFAWSAGRKSLSLGLLIGGLTSWALLPAVCFGALALGRF